MAEIELAGISPRTSKVRTTSSIPTRRSPLIWWNAGSISAGLMRYGDLTSRT
jgi:hypothetical protein